MKYVVGNVDCEGMVGSAALTPESAAQTTALSAKRMVWFLKEGDIALLPETPAIELISEVESISNSQLKSCCFAMAARSEDGALDLLNLEVVCHELESLAASQKVPDEVICYFPSAQVLRKQEALFRDIPSSSCFMKQGGGELLNTKAFFRMAFGECVPLAEGYVCRTKKEFLEATLTLLGLGKDVILKQSLNAGGDGNIAICDPCRNQHFGVSRVFAKGSPSQMKILVEDLWEQMGGRGIEEAVIVEEYCHAQKVIFAEYEITRDSSRHLGDGELRIDATSIEPSLLPGFTIPAQIDPDSRGAFLEAVSTVSEKCREMGYLGRINVDGVLCMNGDLILTEVNARFGGCSHVFHIARLLLGDDFINERVVTTRSYLECTDLGFAVNLAKSIRAESSDTGVVVANEDMNGSGTIQVLSFGSTALECEKIESNFMKQLKNNDFKRLREILN